MTERELQAIELRLAVAREHPAPGDWAAVAEDHSKLIDEIRRLGVEPEPLPEGKIVGMVISGVPIHVRPDPTAAEIVAAINAESKATHTAELTEGGVLLTPKTMSLSFTVDGETHTITSDSGETTTIMVDEPADDEEPPRARINNHVSIPASEAERLGLIPIEPVEAAVHRWKDGGCIGHPEQMYGTPETKAMYDALTRPLVTSTPADLEAHARSLPAPKVGDARSRAADLILRLHLVEGAHLDAIAAEMDYFRCAGEVLRRPAGMADDDYREMLEAVLRRPGGWV